MGIIGASIKEKLTKNLKPSYLLVVDESEKHAGHAGAAAHRAKHGSDSDEKMESHFRVIIVSGEFEGMSRLARHRAVMEVLAEEMPKIHAFSLEAKTPKESN